MQTKGKDKLKHLDIEYYFHLNIKVMSLIGLRCNGPKMTGFAYKIPTFAIIINDVINAIFEFFFITDPIISKDIGLVIQCVSQGIANIQCVCKGFLFVNTIDKLQVVYHEITILSRKFPPKDDIRPLIFNLADETMNFCKYYMMAICSCILSYYMPIAINLVRHVLQDPSSNHTYDFTRNVFLMKYPFTIDTFLIYTPLVCREAICLIVQTIFWVNSDTLFSQITTHLCLQYKILKYDIQKTFDSEGSQGKEILIDLIKRHQQLLRICTLTEDIFSPIIFSAMLLSSANMCVNIIGASEALTDGSYFYIGIYATMLLITVFQVFFFCVFAERITEETRALADTIYNLNWAVKDCDLRFYILLIIMRAQKPFYCTAYGFFPIGHQRLTSIISTAFSYYMMLRTTADK